MRIFFRLVLFVTLFVSVAVSVYAGEDDSFDEFFEDYEIAREHEVVPDPFYWFNYGMYSFNDKLYFWVLKPAVKGYNAVTPLVVRRGIKNFFYNLLFPVRCVNSVLQGKFMGAWNELGIFLINSTAGSLGFTRPAQTVFDMENSNEDFGQTLGSWTMPEGFYLVLPMLGPSTLRDSMGIVGDYLLKPVNYLEPCELSMGIDTFDRINSISFKIKEYEVLKNSSFAPYEAIKDAYLQVQRLKIEN
ncbi:MAG: VacJ family lipoprotein [Thermodesulfobacteriota bacterium]|nr:VacJ family lipoprotein [Thermodesulfobacteriota bacterium]